jgi:hypothetical protein
MKALKGISRSFSLSSMSLMSFASGAWPMAFFMTAISSSCSLL